MKNLQKRACQSTSPNKHIHGHIQLDMEEAMKIVFTEGVFLSPLRLALSEPDSISTDRSNCTPVLCDNQTHTPTQTEALTQVCEVMLLRSFIGLQTPMRCALDKENQTEPIKT